MIIACYIFEDGIVADLISNFEAADALDTCYLLGTYYLVKSSIKLWSWHSLLLIIDVVIVPLIHVSDNKKNVKDQHKEHNNQKLCKLSISTRKNIIVSCTAI